MSDPMTVVTNKDPDPYLDLKPFRHPSISGKAECLECGHPFEMHGWLDKGSHGFTVCPFDFTPAESETPPLPTEPGAMIRAVGIDGDECAVMVRGQSGYWHGVDQDGDERFWVDESVASWKPVTAIPTETWDRLRVLDPMDKRDRIGAGDTQWRWAEGVWRHVCDSDCRTAYSSLDGLSDWYGPLRFADEVSDR